MSDYLQFDYPFPLCNHTDGISDFNIGYAQGVTENGIPFEAELIKDAVETNLSIILPWCVDIFDCEADSMPEFIIDAEPLDLNNVLTKGMIFNGRIDDTDFILGCNEFLESTGIIEFTGQYRNGYSEKYTDANGTELVRFSVTLEGNLGEVCISELDFISFI